MSEPCVTREEALAEGRNTFFTGKPCKYGHISERWVHSYSCLTCHDLASKKYRTTDKCKQYNRKHYEESRVERWARIMLTSAKRRARNSKVPCDITQEDIERVYPKDNKCPILGIELKRNYDQNGSFADESPSLDRIRPEKGYVVGNVIIIALIGFRGRGI